MICIAYYYCCLIIIALIFVTIAKDSVGNKKNTRLATQKEKRKLIYHKKKKKKLKISNKNTRQKQISKKILQIYTCQNTSTQDTTKLFLTSNGCRRENVARRGTANTTACTV